MTLKLRLEKVRAAKKIYHLYQCGLAFIHPDYVLAIEDAFFAMKKGRISDKQLNLLFVAFEYDQDMRARAREERKSNRAKRPEAWKEALKIKIPGSLPAAWSRARKSRK